MSASPRQSLSIGTPGTTERHYRQAQALEAHREFVRVLERGDDDRDGWNSAPLALLARLAGLAGLAGKNLSAEAARTSALRPLCRLKGRAAHQSNC
jgi:hypothetical protein